MGFTVGLSSDLDNGSGGFTWGDISIDTLAPLDWKFLAPTGQNFRPEVVSGFDAIVFAGPGVDAQSFDAPENSPTLLARLGVGYDNIDLTACTKAGVALTITPDGSKKPVATAALTLVLSTMHNLHAKDALARANGWDRRLNGLGVGLNGKTVATIGLGNIGTEFFRLISPFGCNQISYDPWKTQEEADLHNVTLVDLNTLMQEADVIVVLAALTPETRHLINRSKINLMKQSAFLVNISRGALVEESALIDALSAGAIAGAGLDVFETEPTSSDNPLLRMSNVIVTPHNIAWTDELARGMGMSAFGAVKTLHEGKIPPFIVNKEVLQTPQFLAKLAAWR